MANENGDTNIRNAVGVNMVEGCKKGYYMAGYLEWLTGRVMRGIEHEIPAEIGKLSWFRIHRLCVLSCRLKSSLNLSLSAS